MAVIKEDKYEEEEFRSLSPFDQQRFTKKMQEMNMCFKEIILNLKKIREQQVFDLLALEIYREQFGDQINRWTHQISSWETKNPGKTSLTNRLKQDLACHSNDYLKIYSSFKDELHETDNTKAEKSEDLEGNIHETSKLEEAKILERK